MLFWPLKGTCHEIFYTFLKSKTGKNGFTKFFLFAKIFVKNVCPHSQQLRRHCVSVVKDYAVTVSALSRTMWTHVSVVKDYVDIVSA